MVYALIPFVFAIAAEDEVFKKLRAGLSFLPKDNFYGYLLKAEIFADLVKQITLVRKMDAFDIADKENEGRRFDTYLCGIINEKGIALVYRWGFIIIIHWYNYLDYWLYAMV